MRQDGGGLAELDRLEEPVVGAERLPVLIEPFINYKNKLIN